MQPLCSSNLKLVFLVVSLECVGEDEPAERACNSDTTASCAASTEKWQWDQRGIVPSAPSSRVPTILCVNLTPKGHLVQPPYGNSQRSAA